MSTFPYKAFVTFAGDSLHNAPEYVEQIIADIVQAAATQRVPSIPNTISIQEISVTFEG